MRAALRAIAGNFWFTWVPGARALFEELDPARFAALDHNPTALLEDLDDEELAARATPEYRERVQRVVAAARARGGAHDLVGAARRGRHVRGRVLLDRVRARREPADLLRRFGRACGRPPEVRLGPRRAARRASGSCTARAISASSSTTPTGRSSAIRRTTRRGCRSCSSRSRRPSSSPTSRRRSFRCACRCGARKSAACRSTCSIPTSRTIRSGRGRSPTSSTGATASTGCGRSSCSGSAVCVCCAASGSIRPCFT